MISGLQLKILFASIVVIVSGALIGFCINLIKKDNEYKIDICRPIITGIFTVYAYTAFLFSENHFCAVLFDSIYFIGTDWLALFMLMFTISYTRIFKLYRNRIFKVFFILCSIDTVSLIVNNFTHHSFDLLRMSSPLGFYYWGNLFYFVHYVHLAFCYIMVVSVFVMLLLSFISAANLYKYKYFGLLIAYLVVIISNFWCYSTNFPLDFSVILYGVLAGFICYYATYSFPHKLVSLALKSVNESILDAILYFDVSGKLIYANKNAKLVFSDENGFNKVIAERYRENWLSNLDGIEEEYSSHVDSFNVKGKIRHFEIEYQMEYLENVCIGSYIKMTDKTEDINKYRTEQYSATHDYMTTLLNRTGFFEAVDEQVRKYGAVGKVMLCSNIRDFKLINELFGEKVGDEVIMRQASLLKQFSHQESVFARISDDKFALFVDKEHFSEERFNVYVSKLQNLMEGNLYHMHIIIGVYEPQVNNESAQIMYDKAIMAMRQIESSYSKVYSYYDSELMDLLLNEKNISDEFEPALKNGQIQMYLQPIQSKVGNRKGAEALSRWYHPVRGMLYPKSFIRTLEKTGLVHKLDDYIWEEAVKTLHRWKELGFKDRYISINVSEKDFLYIDLYSRFTELVQKYDVNPYNLKIEITETVLMSDFQRALEVSSRLQQFGFFVSIDHFGNGYSSLNMLKDFKANELKIDTAFIKETAEESRSHIILKSIIEMAKSLNMLICAEGVETKEQSDMLLQFDCDEIQGNYFSEPLSQEEYEAAENIR